MFPAEGLVCSGFHSRKVLVVFLALGLYQVLGDGADSRQLSEIVDQVLKGGTGVEETHWKAERKREVCSLCLCE